MELCKPNNWDTCREEKMGCPGCHYELPNKPKFNKNPSNILEELKNTVNDITTLNCMRCDKPLVIISNFKNDNKTPIVYCEECIQSIIAENAKLQLKLDELGGRYERS